MSDYLCLVKLFSQTSNLIIPSHFALLASNSRYFEEKGKILKKVLYFLVLLILKFCCCPSNIHTVYMKPNLSWFVQYLFRPTEGIQAASCKSWLLLLLQVQSNLLGQFLRLCIISQIILLSKSQLYGLSNVVAAVNKAFSFGLIHACQCLFSLDLGDRCVISLFVVCKPKFYGRVVFQFRKSLLENLKSCFFAILHYRVMSLTFVGSCVHDGIVNRNTINYSKSKV